MEAAQACRTARPRLATPVYPLGDAARKTDCQGSDSEEPSEFALLDVAHATGLSTGYEIRFARGRVRLRPWCAVNHRPLVGPPRSLLRREFEVVVLIAVVRRRDGWVGLSAARKIRREPGSTMAGFQRERNGALLGGPGVVCSKTLDAPNIVRDGRITPIPHPVEELRQGARGHRATVCRLLVQVLAETQFPSSRHPCKSKSRRKARRFSKRARESARFVDPDSGLRTSAPRRMVPASDAGPDIHLLSQARESRHR